MGPAARSSGRGKGQSGGEKSIQETAINGNDAGTFTTSSKKTEFAGIRDARALLKLNNLLVNDEKGANSAKGKEIIENAKEIISNERLSPRDPVITQKFLKKRQKKELANEDTFMWIMWRILVGEERTVRANPEQQDEEDGEVLLRREWDLDGLDFRINQEFQPGSIPLMDTDNDPSLEALIEKLPGVKNPKPDLAYGLDEGVFTKEEIYANSRLKETAQLSPDMYHPFFVVEFKSAGGTMPDAVNQACRGGAAMTQAKKQLEAEAEYICEDIYDNGSFAFSLSITTDTAHIHVHWRDVNSEGQDVYYMQFLEPYSLLVAKQVEDLRVALNNILDWGIKDHKKHVQLLLQAVIKKLTTANQTSKTKKSEKSAKESAKESSKGKNPVGKSAKGTAKGKGVQNEKDAEDDREESNEANDPKSRYSFRH